jgi:DUF917 family protein
MTQPRLRHVPLSSLTPDRLHSIAEGAALLGAGGGGTVAVARQLIEVVDRLTHGAGVDVLTAPFDGLPDGALVAVAADVGASDTFVENQDLATLHAFQALGAAIGSDRPLAAVVPGEVGPESTLAAIVVAAHLGLPVLDADGAGRALPTLPLSLFDVGGISASPCAIAGTGLDSAVLRAADADGIEALMRPLLSLPAFGDSAGMALWAMRPSDVNALGVLGTMRLVETIGDALREARSAQPRRDPAESVLALDGLCGAVLARGRLTPVTAADDGGFTADVLRIEQQTGADVVVVGENENLVVWRADRPDPIATAPDLACWIDANGRATTTSDLVADPSLHADVTLLGLRSDDRLWSTAALPRFVEVLNSVGYWGPPVRTPVSG